MQHVADFNDANEYYQSDVNASEIDAGLRLKLIENPGLEFEQPFNDPAGFTLDTALAEFVKTIPTTFAAKYDTDVNGTYGDGVLTGTPINGAGVSNSKLDLTGGAVKYVDYTAVGNANSLIQKGAIKFKLTPGYSGNPSGDRSFFTISKTDSDSDNLIFLRHKSTGEIQILINSLAGTVVVGGIVATWNPTALAEYEFELNIDITTGATRLFIDGVQLGSTFVGTGTRDANIALLRVGSNVDGADSSDFLIRDFLVFDDVQHTANYTPGYIVGDEQNKQIQSKDTTPTNSILATNFKSFNLNWRKDGGSTVGTQNGSPTIVGEKLQCFGAHGVYYEEQTKLIETLKVKYTPNYGPSPASTLNMISIYNGIDNNDRVLLASDVGNSLKVFLNNSTGGVIYSAQQIGAAFPFTNGQTYEVELVINSINGTVRLFINGVLRGTLSPGAWTRGTAASRYYVGAGDGFNLANATFDDYVIFDNAQHTAGYTPGYTINDFIYLENKADWPAFVYSGIGAIQSIDDCAIVFGGLPRVITGGYWYNTVSLAWEVSNGSYAQANTPAEFHAAVINFPVEGSGSVAMSIVFPGSNTRASMDDFIIEMTGQIYSQDEQIVKFAAAGLLNVYDILSMAWTGKTTPANTSLGLAFMVSGVAKYYNVGNSAWEASNQTLAQSNTDWGVLTPAVMQALIEPDSGNTYTPVFILYSSNGLATPELITFTTNFIFWNSEGTTLSECVIWLYIRDLLGDANPDDARLYVESESAFWVDGRLIKEYYRNSDIVDSQGWVQLSVIQTESVSQLLRFYIKYTDPNDGTTKTIPFLDTTVPNQTSVDGGELLTVDAA